MYNHKLIYIVQMKIKLIILRQLHYNQVSIEKPAPPFQKIIWNPSLDTVGTF